MTRQAPFQLFQLCPTALIHHIPRGLLYHTADNSLKMEYFKVAVGTSEKTYEILRGELHFSCERSRVIASFDCIITSQFNSNH